MIVKGCLLGLQVSSSSLWRWICKNTHESELQTCEYTQLKDEKDGVLCGHNVDITLDCILQSVINEEIGNKVLIPSDSIIIMTKNKVF